MKNYIPAMSRPSQGSELVSLLTNFGVETSQVFLPLYAESVGASRLQVGVIGGVYGAAYFISSWLFGRQSDIRGRLLFIRLGLALTTLAFAAQVLTTNPHVLMLVRALVGFCLGMSVAALMAYNFESGGSTGRFASLGSLGFLLGDVVASAFHSFHGLFLLGAASCVVAFAISMRLKEPEKRAALKPATFQVVRRNLRVYLSVFVRHFGANMMWAILPLFFGSLGANQTWIGILLAINNGGQFAVMLLVGRFRESRIFVAGFLFSALVFLGYAAATNYLQLIPIQALLAVAWSCLYVGALVLLLQRNEERATATGLLFSTLSLSQATGPFLGGVVAQYGGYQAVSYVAAVCCASGLGIARVKAKQAG